RFYQRADGEWVTSRPSGQSETLDVTPSKAGILGLLNNRCRDARRMPAGPIMPPAAAAPPQHKLPPLCPFKHPAYDEIVWAGRGIDGYFRKPRLDAAGAAAYR